MFNSSFRDGGFFILDFLGCLGVSFLFVFIGDIVLELYSVWVCVWGCVYVRV